jgi:tetratricopeptide (TPR) repeat protein
MADQTAKVEKAPEAPSQAAPSPAPTPPPRTAEELIEAPSEGGGLLNKINPLRIFKKDSPASLVRAGRELEGNRSLAQATIMYNKALALDPNYAAAYEGLGNVLVKKGGRSNVEAAIQQYQQAINRNPFNDTAYKATARAYDMLGKRKEAALEKKKMVVVRTLQADPGNPAANNNMGILFMQQGHTNSAVDYFGRAIKTDPRYETALRNLGVIFYKLTSESDDDAKKTAYLERAREYVRRALEVSQSPLTLLAHVRILILEEQYEEALAACEKVEKIDAAMKEAFGLKKVVLMKLNRLEEANKAYETYRFLNSHE